MANQAIAVKMYVSSGWQNVAEYSQKRCEYPIRTSDIPAGHAYSAMSYTHARNESLEELVEGLKQAANVSSLRFKVIDEAAQ